MNNTNIKLIITAIILLCISISLKTYSSYKNNVQGSGSATTANWKVKVNGTDTKTKTFIIKEEDITWIDTKTKSSNKIAPGAKGTITIEIDATDTEVDVEYKISMDQVKLDNNNSNISFSIAEESEEDTEGVLYYKTSNMKKTVTLNIIWDAKEEDSEEKDNIDISASGKEIEIPIVVSATQYINE